MLNVHENSKKRHKLTYTVRPLLTRDRLCAPITIRSRGITGQKDSLIPLLYKPTLESKTS
jgi:hypothetical protein